MSEASKKLKRYFLMGISFITVILFFQNCGKFKNSSDSLDSTLGEQSSQQVLSSVQIANGDSHSCQVNDQGGVQCWGSNTHGELGTGSRSDKPLTSQKVFGLTEVIALTAGSSHTCALVKSGKVLCWGGNEYGQLGDGTFIERWVPSEVQGIKDVVAIASRFSQVCGLLADRHMWCWGRNENGQLGNGANEKSADPVQVANLDEVAAMAVGGRHACAVLKSGAVSCWGKNSIGQLGNGNTIDSLVPVTVQNLSDVKSLSLGFESSCAVTQTGRVSCWGSNSLGQLGGSSSSNGYSAVAGAVPGLTDVIEMVSGGYYNCALLRSRGLRCWGYNYVNILGNKSFEPAMTPIEVVGLSGVTAIAAGASHTCVVNLAKETYCWGSNYNGQFGTGKTDLVTTPVQVSGIANNRLLINGSGFSCSLLSSGQVKCWGIGNSGVIGNGLDKGLYPVPVDVSKIVAASDIAASPSQVCVVESAKVKCWGTNAYGTPYKDVLKSNVPVDIPEITNASKVVVGNYHACALTTDAKVKCWGYNHKGQIGNNVDLSAQPSVDPVVLTPQLVSDLSGVISISAGEYHSCAVLTGGQVYCWGLLNSGLGDSFVTKVSSKPILIDSLKTAVQVYTNMRTNCVRMAEGTLQCWGDNTAGALGDGTTIVRAIPVAVKGLSAVKAVAIGYSQTCAIRNDGKPLCWGVLPWGWTTGSLSDASSLAPLLSDVFVSSDQISLGSGFSCLSLSGLIRCTGNASLGQLGDNPDRFAPQRVPTVN